MDGAERFEPSGGGCEGQVELSLEGIGLLTSVDPHTNPSPRMTPINPVSQSAKKPESFSCQFSPA